MTQPAAPPNSGAPQPVQGVTGGPAVFGGQISNDPNDGSIVVAPNPGNVFQLRKGNNPQALQIYERFTSNTIYTRLGFYAQLNGPFLITTEFSGGAPQGARELDINAGTTLKLQQASADRLIIGVNNTSITAPAAGQVSLQNNAVDRVLVNSTITRIIGTTNDSSAYAFVVNNAALTANNLLVRNDGLCQLANGFVSADPAPSIASGTSAVLTIAGNTVAIAAAKSGIAIGGISGGSVANYGINITMPTGANPCCINAPTAPGQVAMIINGTNANGYGFGINSGELTIFTGASQTIGFRDTSVVGTLGCVITPANGTLSVSSAGGGFLKVTSALAGTSIGGQLCIASISIGGASAGANGALPATVAGYLVWNLSGITIKIPYYNN